MINNYSVVFKNFACVTFNCTHFASHDKFLMFYLDESVIGSVYLPDVDLIEKFEYRYINHELKDYREDIFKGGVFVE